MAEMSYRDVLAALLDFTAQRVEVTFWDTADVPTLVAAFSGQLTEGTGFQSAGDKDAIVLRIVTGEGEVGEHVAAVNLSSEAVTDAALVEGSLVIRFAGSEVHLQRSGLA